MKRTKENRRENSQKVRHGRRDRWSREMRRVRKWMERNWKLKLKATLLSRRRRRRKVVAREERERKETPNLHNDYANYVSLELGRFFYLFSVSFSIYSLSPARPSRSDDDSMCCSQFTFSSEFPRFYFLRLLTGGVRTAPRAREVFTTMRDEIVFLFFQLASSTRDILLFTRRSFHSTLLL